MSFQETHAIIEELCTPKAMQTDASTVPGNQLSLLIQYCTQQRIQFDEKHPSFVKSEMWHNSV